MTPRTEDRWNAAFFGVVLLWIVLEILPAFFDGRVAAAIGGK